MTNDVATLKQEAESLTVTATRMLVTDAASYELAGEFLKGTATYIRRVGEVLDPIVAAAHNAHKVAVAQRDALLRPAQGAKRILGQRMAQWEQEQAELRRAAERETQRIREQAEQEARARAAAEQARLQHEAETKRLEEAAQLENRGDNAGAERLIAEPLVVGQVAVGVVFTPVPSMPPAPKVTGVAFPTHWHAEVTDLTALVDAVAVGQQPISLLLPNEQALNQLARALKGTLRIPGVKAVETRTTTVRP